MKYDKQDRRAIKELSERAERQFKILERCEQGGLVAVPELCRALEASPTFVAFSCLSGDGATEELDPNIGQVFVGRKQKRINELLGELCEAGRAPFRVMIDDCEPSRMWLWETDQSEISMWCELFMDTERGLGHIPESWGVELWSSVESRCEESFARMLEQVEAEKRYELLIHQNLEHIRRFPNKKRVGDGRKSTVRKVAQYALQGLALEQLFPNAILLQLETPWRVKDPLYDSMRQNPLPIVHPFPDERR